MRHNRRNFNSAILAAIGLLIDDERIKNVSLETGISEKYLYTLERQVRCAEIRLGWRDDSLSLAQSEMFREFKLDKKRVSRFDERNHWWEYGCRHPEVEEWAKLKYSPRNHKSDYVNLANKLRRVTNHAIVRNRDFEQLWSLWGCKVSEVRKHIELQFLSGMTWANHGEWHIDHKRPLAAFDLSDPAQQRACFHPSNLQPLWARDNAQKNSKFGGVRFYHKKSK